MPPAFTMTRRVQFAETDMAGIMHFANAFRMMEEVEHAFFRSLGTSVAIVEAKRQLGWPRVNVSCEYFAPVRFEDELELRLRILDVGDRSLTHEVEFRLGDALIARTTATIASCAVRDGRLEAIPIPDELRSRLRDAVGPAGSESIRG